MTHPGLAACVFLGKLAMGTNVRSSAVSASGRYRLLVSIPRKTLSPAAGRGAKSTKSWRSRSASIWPSSSASYKLAQVRSKNGENDNSGKLLAPASTSERIHQIEQGVFRIAKAGVHPVTKFLQCVKVHESNAPEFVLVDTLLPLSNPLTRSAEGNLV